MQPEINEAEGHLAPLKKVTPVSKYLAMALFIILPFLGGWIGYTFAPEKVVEVEKVVVQEPDEMSESESTNDAEHNAASKESIIFPNSQELLLELPVGWNYIQPNIYDDEGRIVFSLSYPIREVGYEPLDAANVRDITTSSGLEFRVVDRVEREDRSIGFAHYVSGVQKDWEGDYLQDSFEIMVRYNDRGQYVSSDMQPGEYIETRYKSYTEYLAEEEYIQDLIEGISRNTENVLNKEKAANLKPKIVVLDYKRDRPANIKIQYENMPLNAGGLALCIPDGACTEWVDSTFSSITSDGTYTMGTTKGVGTGEYTIMVIGDSFTDQLFVSEPFTIE